MVGGVDHFERGQRQPLDDPFEQRQLRQSVAGAVDEQEWHAQGGQVGGALVSGLPGRMQRKCQEGDAQDVRERLARGGKGRHPAAHGAPAGDERQIGGPESEAARAAARTVASSFGCGSTRRRPACM